MLKLRLYTALILIPIIIACVFFLPPLTFLSLALVTILLAGWEWTQLAQIQQTSKKILFLVVLSAALLGTIFVPIYWIIGVALIWWIFALTLFFIYPKGTSWWAKDSLIRSVMGLFVLVPCWIGLIILQGFSPIVLMFTLVMIWGVDTGAYLIGKRWGSHQLAPVVSPKKTYEGMIGGLLTAVVIAVLGFWLLEIPGDRWLLFLGICLLGGLFTVIGDLFESMLKRQAQIKDTGSLLPGHGGLLDRIDSMTIAVPFFALVFPFFFNS